MSGDSRDEPWYSVRCLIHFPDPDPGRTAVYEERITLWRAARSDEAIARAEAEAEEFAADVNGEYLGFAQAYHLAVEGEVGDATEVFSLLRDSSLEPDEYIDRFFVTGAERERHTD